MINIIIVKIFYNGSKSMTKKNTIEFRYYDMNPGDYLFALLGENWIREYGHDIDVLHFHNYLEIGYCRFGDGTMEFADQIKEYHKGNITVIPKNYPHTTNSLQDTLSYWEYLFVDVDTFLNNVMSHRKFDAKNMINDINSGVFYFHEDDYLDLADNIKEIMEIMRYQKDYYLDEAHGLLKSVLIKIARENSSRNSSSYIEMPKNLDSRSSSIIFNVLDYINENYRQDIKISDVAAACYVSETHLRRLFNNHMRIGVLEYINLIRINKACEIMRHSNDSIASIAYSCGFSSLTTFNRNFNKYFKVSANNWRKSAENYEQMLEKSFVHFEEGWK